MKIILVAPPSEFNNQLQRAFEKKGAEIKYVNERANYAIPILAESSLLAKKLIWRWRGLKKLNKLKFNEFLVRQCQQHKPDVLFVSKGTSVSVDALGVMKNIGVKTVNWFPDNIFSSTYNTWFSRTFPHYDLFLIFDSLAVNSYGDTGKGRLIYMPFAINPAEYKFSDDKGKDIKSEVCFVGAYYPEREKILSPIKDYGLRIYGWKGWEKSSLAAYYHGPLELEDFARLYKNSKICINMNTVPAANGVNVRTFEIPASGGFQLSDYRSDIEELFTVGKEIEVFNNAEELREKVEFYLDEKNSELRSKIAGAGQVRIYRDHTFDRRIEQILNLL